MKHLTYLILALSAFFYLPVYAQTSQTTTTTTTVATPDTTTTTPTTTVVTPDTTTTTTAPAVVERVIVTPAPSPKEVIVIPKGYAGCFSIAAGWRNDVWVAEHKVCQYQNTPDGIAWVDGYWVCDKVDVNNACTDWTWTSGHWVKTFDVY